MSRHPSNAAVSYAPLYSALAVCILRHRHSVNSRSRCQGNADCRAARAPWLSQGNRMSVGCFWAASSHMQPLSQDALALARSREHPMSVPSRAVFCARSWRASWRRSSRHSILQTLSSHTYIPGYEPYSPWACLLIGEYVQLPAGQSARWRRECVAPCCNSSPRPQSSRLADRHRQEI